jgi:uncharacterized protein (DUF885 family)
MFSTFTVFTVRYYFHPQGWGLYAESLGEEMKLYKTDYDMSV